MGESAETRLFEYSEEYQNQEISINVHRVFDGDKLVKWHYDSNVSNVMVDSSGLFEGVTEEERLNLSLDWFMKFDEFRFRKNIKFIYYDKQISGVEVGKEYESCLGRKFKVVRIEGADAFESDGYSVPLRMLATWKDITGEVDGIHTEVDTQTSQGV